MDLTLLSVKPLFPAISEIEAAYQYRLRNMSLSVLPKLSSMLRIAAFSSRIPISFSTSAPGSSVSASSSSTAGISPPPRLRLLPSRSRFRESHLVSFARYGARYVGRWVGMEFHADRYVSLTHSSASSAFAKMLYEIVRQYEPYFAAVWDMASSERAQ